MVKYITKETRNQVWNIKLLINLLFSDEENRLKQEVIRSDIDWDMLLTIAQRERVLSPVLTRIMSVLSSEPYNNTKSLVQKKLDECRERSRTALGLISGIQDVLTKDKIGFVVFKTLDDYPNIPSEDIDIMIVKEDIRKAEDAFLNLETKPYLYEKGPLAYTGETPEKRHFHFKLGVFHFEVELYPELTLLGEEYIPAVDIIRNLSPKNFDGKTVFLPSQEDDLLILVIHAVFKHGGLIRLSDIYTAKRLLENEHLDWSHIFSRSYESWIIVGLIYFLDIINSFFSEQYGRPLLPNHVLHFTKSLSKKGIPRIREIPYRIPWFALFYIYKTIADASRLRWCSALKTFQACIFKTFGRTLFCIYKLTHTYSSLKRWGWYLSIKL